MNMNMNLEDVLNNAGGTPPAGGAGAPAGEGDAKDKRIAELEKELQRERVEGGRLNKANDEIAKLREENERLKREHGSEAVLKGVSKETLEQTPDDVKRFASEAIAGAVGAERERHEAEMRELREQNARQATAMFAQRINAAFPGISERIRKGGEWNEAWVKYQLHNAGSITSAIKTGNFDTIFYHFNRFMSEANVQLPSGVQPGSAAAEPRAMGGGVPQTPGAEAGKIYTVAEYTRLMNQAQEKFQRHEISANDYRGICGELEKAHREGRVKG